VIYYTESAIIAGFEEIRERLEKSISENCCHIKPEKIEILPGSGDFNHSKILT
jgi:hypothetical protein